MAENSRLGNLEAAGSNPTTLDPSSELLHPHDFSDAMWEAARRAGIDQGRKYTGGNRAYAEDLAADVLATLYAQNTPIHPKAVCAYVRKAVFNRVCDDARKDNAAFRGGAAEVRLAPEDFVEYEGRITALIPAMSSDPAVLVTEDERQRGLVDAGATLLAMLEERNRDLVRMALMEQCPHAEIAKALGFKNANVVKQTLHRTVDRLRKQAPEGYRDLLAPNGDR